MNVEISEETAEQLRALALNRGFETVESALAGIIAAESERDDDYEAKLDVLLEEARSDIAAGRCQVLTRELAADIAREGRERRAKRDADLAG